MDTLSYCHLKRVVRDIKFSRTSFQGQKLTPYTKRNSDKITVCVLIGLQKRTHKSLQLLFLQIPSSYALIPSFHPFHCTHPFKSHLASMGPPLSTFPPPIAPDVSICDDWYSVAGFKATFIDCQQALQLLPSGPKDLPWVLRPDPQMPGHPYMLPYNATYGESVSHHS